MENIESMHVYLKLHLLHFLLCSSDWHEQDLAAFLKCTSYPCRNSSLVNCMRLSTAAARLFSTSSTHSLVSPVRLSSSRFLGLHTRKITFAASACRMASTSSNGNNSSSSTALPTSKIVTKEKIYDEHWQLPQGTPVPNLKVFNSLTRSKVRLEGYVQQSSYSSVY